MLIRYVASTEPPHPPPSDLTTGVAVEDAPGRAAFPFYRAQLSL